MTHLYMLDGKELGQAVDINELIKSLLTSSCYCKIENTNHCPLLAFAAFCFLLHTSSASFLSPPATRCSLINAKARRRRHRDSS